MSVPVPPVHKIFTRVCLFTLILRCFFLLIVYKKHYPPAMNDEVWRLEKIGKDGSFHRRLNNAGIFTVEDFLRLVIRDSQKLRTVSTFTLIFL